MDEILPQLLSFPPHPPPVQPLSDGQYDTQIRAILQILNKLSSSLLVGGVQGGGDLLDILDPSINSLSYLYTLLAHIHAAQDRPGKMNNASDKTPTVSSIGPLWTKTIEFLDRYDPRQIRYAGAEWRRVLEIVARSARSFGKPLLAVRPIKEAILRLDPGSSTFTSNHVLFVRLCLEANTYRAGLDILDRDILEFPSANTNMPSLPSTGDQPSSMYITPNSNLSAKLAYTDHLEYHLYGAMVYIGLKKWERALEFLELVISAPTANAASTIMVEAYKKWVLVSLLHRGRLLTMPRTTNSNVAKVFHSLARAYEMLAEVFKKGNVERLSAEIEAGREIWRSDSNTGLVKLLIDGRDRFSIRNLEKTYSTLLTPQITQRRLFSHGRPSDQPITAADNSATEQTILSMMASHELHATLAHPSSSPSEPSVLRFASTSPTSSEASQLAAVDGQIERLVRLSAQMQQMDRRIGLSREYVSWAQRAKKGKEAAGAASGDAMDLEWEEEGDDGGQGDGMMLMEEDMMAGM